MESRDVRLIVGRYPAGERVKVSVNPRDPTDSVLVPGPDLEDLLLLGAGLLLMIFRRRRAPQRREAGRCRDLPGAARSPLPDRQDPCRDRRRAVPVRSEGLVPRVEQRPLAEGRWTRRLFQFSLRRDPALV